MSLETDIIALAEAVGAGVKSLELKIGDLSQLPTRNKNNLVDAIKEAINDAVASGAGVKSHDLKIGDLSQLPTRNKNNLVDAINEIINDVSGFIAPIDDAAGLGKTKVTWSAGKSSRELANKVDKVLGHSLVGDDEIVKLLTVEQDAQKNTINSVAGRQGDVLLNKEDVGLSSVDNTSDINKPISNPTQTALDNKVDKQAGKELSDTNFTQAEKDKLSSLESSKFVGLYVSESALPATGSDGDYANVDGGAGGIYRVLWVSSDNKWVRVQGVSTELTDAQIKQQYESNPDTNPFKDDEKDKLSGVAVEATKNRADSENADKVHSHNINDVTGLSERLSDIDVLRSDLGNPDKGAAMVARSVVVVNSVADLLALPTIHRRDDLRYLVNERVAGSGVGGGEFIWDGTSTEELNGGTVFSLDERMSGRFVRLFEGALRSYWFLDGDKSDLGYVQKALNFAVTSGLDIELEHNETFKTTTPFVIGPASGNYRGTISGNLKITTNSGFPPEASALTIRYCNGEISANILVNGTWKCRVAIEYQGTGNLTLSGNVHGRRATLWGQLMTSLLDNSNGMRWLGELRGSLSGSNYTQDFQHLSSNISTSTIATPEISEIGANSTICINERWYHIDSSNHEETVIRPSLPTKDQTDGSMQIFIGGGFLTYGSDAGVGVVTKMIMQANHGVGMRSGSLYGQVVTTFVGEMNEGPSIVVGSSTTSANLKNVFLDSYFEGGTKHSVVVMSVNGQISMPSHFNLGDDGVYIVPSHSTAYGTVDIPRHPNIHNHSAYGTASSRERNVKAYLGGYYFFRSRTATTDNYNIILTPSSGEVEGGITMILHDFSNRPVIFTCSKGQNINGMPSITLNSPGTVGITAVKTADGWALSSFETTILVGS